MKDVHATGEGPAPKREHPALSTYLFFHFFVSFDPDPEPADENPGGSGSTTFI
jgi:hypothetical protein